MNVPMRNLMDPALRGYLITDVGRLMRKWFTQRSSVKGHALVQWTMIARLWDDGGLKQAEMADLLEIEPITLSRNIDKLEKEGLIERRTDTSDRRVWRLFLTPEAKPLMDEISRARNEVVATLFEGVSEEEQAVFQKVLVSLRENLQRKVR